MGYKAKFGRNFSRIEPQKIGLAVLASLVIFSMMLLSMSIPRSIPLANLSLRLSLRPVPRVSIEKGETNSDHLESADDSLTAETKHENDGRQSVKNLRERGDAVRVYGNSLPAESDNNSDKDDSLKFNVVTQNSSSKIVNSSHIEDSKGDMNARLNLSTRNYNEDDDQLHILSKKNISTTIIETTVAFANSSRSNGDQIEAANAINDSLQKEHFNGSIVLPTNSSAAFAAIASLNSTSEEGKEDNGENSYVLEVTKSSQPLCNFSDPRYDICDMAGDIRIHGNSSCVVFISSERNESWQIRPYARKGDEKALGNVRQLNVRTSSEGPFCTLRYSVPAIIFSVTGFTGNLFHDFTDVLIPLFVTARRYDGEVQFLVTDLNHWWVYKYRLFFKALSRYDLIDFNRDERVHCFKQVIIGLHCHKELSIDPARSPEGHTMVDFTAFLRRAYSLPRDLPVQLDQLNYNKSHLQRPNSDKQKPRLLLIARKHTRTLLNVNETVAMASEVGFDVIIDEADVSSDVARFARVVNSCDVMVGVHGAGLTNLVFLPVNAVVIQIVPWGRLEWICMLDFGEGAKDAKLKYLQYSIKAEESSLIDIYPKDHPVFGDPFKYHNRGWDLLRETFMDKQNVRLDIERFRAVLNEALDHLRSK